MNSPCSVIYWVYRGTEDDVRQSCNLANYRLEIKTIAVYISQDQNVRTI